MKIEFEQALITLETGLHGDYTVKTSDELYSSPAMLDLLLHDYHEHSKNKKTLIFNNGIFTSKRVCQVFTDLGLPVKHLDNKTSPSERTDILKWFKKTKGAILTSVSILTTGFDEPSELRAKFPNSLEISFDIQKSYQAAVEKRRNRRQ